MTVEELYKYCVRNGHEDKEIVVNITCSDSYYSKYNIPLDENDIYVIFENVEISVEC